MTNGCKCHATHITGYCNEKRITELNKGAMCLINADIAYNFVQVNCNIFVDRSARLLDFVLAFAN